MKETIEELKTEIEHLKNAIRTHRNKSGHNLCWLNDVELWRTLGEEVSYPHGTLPVREEFLRQCKRFYESRIQGTPYEEPVPQKTITTGRKS
jgi:hypothetical protein